MEPQVSGLLGYRQLDLAAQYWELLGYVQGGLKRVREVGWSNLQSMREGHRWSSEQPMAYWDIVQERKPLESGIPGRIMLSNNVLDSSGHRSERCL